MTAIELFRAGRLNDAVAAAGAEVKASPTDRGRRWLLCQTLYFTGDLERADRQLDLLADQDPGSLESVQLHRHLLRGESQRRQVFTQGRIPGFFVGPEAQLRQRLEALTNLRADAVPEAEALLNKAEVDRPVIPGSFLGRGFADFRDMDDLAAGFFEIITGDGEYHWLPMSAVREITFHPPARPYDLVWRRGLVTLLDGARGQMYFPALYPLSYADPRDEIRLGRLTDWVEQGSVIRGLGLRSFLMGDSQMAFPELLSITFSPPVMDGVTEGGMAVGMAPAKPAAAALDQKGG